MDIIPLYATYHRNQSLLSSALSLLDLIFSRCYAICESRESTSNMQRNILASVAFRCKVRTSKQIGQRDTNRQRLLPLEEMYIHTHTHTHNTHTLSSVAANDRLSIMYMAESSSSSSSSSSSNRINKLTSENSLRALII